MTIRTVCVLLAALFAVSLGTVGCNLTGGIDNPKSHDELVSSAQAQIDQGNCDDAITTLTGISPQDNRVLQMTGTAHLCRAGASMNMVEGTLGNYNANSQNFSVVGDLANKMIPVTSATDTKIVAAINAFGSMSQTDEKSVWVAYANIVRAAGLLAKATSDNASVKRADVSVTGCVSANCVSGSAACTAVNMNDTDANNLINALVAAANAVGSASSIGAARDFAVSLGASAAQTAAGGRCTAVNNLLSK